MSEARADDVLEQLELPPIYCPLESRINPARPVVERRALEWIERLGLGRDARQRSAAAGTHSADFYSRFAPFADDEGLLVAALWVYWGFVFDDARCDAGYYSARPARFVPMAARVQRALEVPGGYDDDVYARSLGDIAERLCALGTPVQFQRFVASHRAWLGGVAWQIANQALDRMPALEDYLTMRLHSAGGEPTFSLLEIADGEEVPAAEMDSPAVRALTETAILTAALDNDRHSIAKELTRGHSSQNIYTVLREHNGGSLAAASRDATRLRDRVFCRFLRLRERMLPRLSAPGRRYADGLAYGIRGNAEWGLRVPRYLTGDLTPAGPETARGVETPIAWADRPSDDGTEPIPLPTAAWWWQV